MTKNSRVTHITRHYSLKFGQVQKRIAENACFVWVVYGETFRDATFAEAAAMRKEQAKQPQGMCYFVEMLGRDGKVKLVARPYYAEIPSFHVKWTQPAQQAIQRHSYQLIAQANKFCLEHA